MAPAKQPPEFETLGMSPISDTIDVEFMSPQMHQQPEMAEQPEMVQPEMVQPEMVVSPHPQSPPEDQDWPEDPLVHPAMATNPYEQDPIYPENAPENHFVPPPPVHLPDKGLTAWLRHMQRKESESNRSSLIKSIKSILF